MSNRIVIHPLFPLHSTFHSTITGDERVATHQRTIYVLLVQSVRQSSNEFPKYRFQEAGDRCHSCYYYCTVSCERLLRPEVNEQPLLSLHASGVFTGLISV